MEFSPLGTVTVLARGLAAVELKLVRSRWAWSGPVGRGYLIKASVLDRLERVPST